MQDEQVRTHILHEGEQVRADDDGGACAGALTSTTAIFWAWANYTGRLPEPTLEGIDPGEVEVHGEQTV